jgi:NADH:ubiquinone oxidoreductase subunit H
MNGSCKFSTGIREDILVSFVSIIISVLVNVIYFVLFDRFIMGAVQRRSGPYIVG